MQNDCASELYRSHSCLPVIWSVQGDMADNVLEEEMENMESSLAIEIMDGRKSKNTKNQYRLKIESVKKWLHLKHPACLNESGSIILTLVDKTILK